MAAYSLAMNKTIKVSVWRGRTEGAFEDFEVPRQPSQTVLDVITYIQRNLDATLSYRFACRVGVCGSCAMTVNGRPRWTCRTHVNKVATDGTSACDVVEWNKDYLGPAALNRAWTLVNDVRDGGNAKRLAAVAGDRGCHACHSQQGCVEHCPKQISPTHSIAGLKRAVATSTLKQIFGGDA